MNHKTKVAFARAELKNLDEQLETFYRHFKKQLRDFSETLDLLERS